MYVIITIVAFIVILGVLVLVHELGHFLTARLFGVRVEEFGVGFPPRLYPRPRKVKRLREAGKTVYSVNALPLGGFVRLAGENGVSPAAAEQSRGSQTTEGTEGTPLSLSGGVVGADDPGAFGNKPAWQRAIVLVAGTFNNMLLAMLLLFLVLAVIGTPHTGEEIIAVAPHSPAQAAGLQPGDLIQGIGGQSVQGQADVQSLVQEYAGQRVAVTVTRSGTSHTIYLVPRRSPPCGQGAMGVVTTAINQHYVPTDLGTATGAALNVPLAVVQGLIALPSALSAAPQQQLPQCDPTYITFGSTPVPESALQAVHVKGEVPVDQCIPTSSSGVGIAGPIGIVRQVGCEANAIPQQGWVPLLSLVIELSATLAVINLLPIPALDGGRLLFVLISVVARRRVRPEVEALAHAIGMAALLSLILFISVHDLSNWLGNKPPL